MNFLARDQVDLPGSVWEGIDIAVKDTCKDILVGRRFLELYGPLGAGITSIQLDRGDVKETVQNGFVRTEGRAYVEVPLFYEDFTLTWRELENAGRMNIPLDYSRVNAAATEMAIKEDQLVFYGNEHLGTKGLLTDEGVSRVGRSDWGEGENAFMQVADGLAQLRSKYIIGRYVLIVSPDIYASLYRIQPGLGMTEADRLGKLLNGRLLNAPLLGKGQAVLICAESDEMDLVIGKDIDTAFLDRVDMNYHFRIFETAAFRLKNPEAVIVFE